MANICVNNIAFIASNNNLKELKRLYNDIEKISNYDKNFGDLEEMFEITTLENIYSYFIISTATSWTPKPEVWDSILNEYSEIDYVYTSEECGFNIYINTDESREIFEESFVVY